ncbi:hypothetical protein [Oerskovia turbata]
MVLAGALGASLLAFSLAVSVPQRALALTLLLVAALPLCAVVVGWSLAPRHMAAPGARLVLTEDDREWAVVRGPLARAMTDGARFEARAEQRALADRAVAAYAVGRVEEIEALRLLDRVVALERLVGGAFGGAGWTGLTPQQRELLGSHVRDAIERDISLLESRQAARPRWPALGLPVASAVMP